jgi:hypothetical protein
MTARSAVSPNSNAIKTVCATWISNHATAAYAAPTRSTLRRRSSAKKDIAMGALPREE